MKVASVEPEKNWQSVGSVVGGLLAGIENRVVRSEAQPKNPVGIPLRTASAAQPQVPGRAASKRLAA